MVILIKPKALSPVMNQQPGLFVLGLCRHSEASRNPSDHIDCIEVEELNSVICHKSAVLDFKHTHIILIITY